MVKASLGDVIGGWAFLIGVLLAVVVGLFPAAGTTAVLTVLVVVGLLIGFLNVGDKEVTQFLFSGLVLVLIGNAGGSLTELVPFLAGILSALMAVFIPATVVVAVKNVLNLARRK